MAYGVVRSHKLEKNRKQLDNTTDSFSSPSTTSYSYDNLNGNTDTNSKKELTSLTNSRTIFSLEDKTSDII